MAKFRYKLQNILDIKNKMENQAKSAYATANARLLREQDRLEQMIVEKRELEDRYRILAVGVINPRDLLEARRAIDFQRELIKGQLVEIKVAEKNLEVARIRLNEAVKDRKIHEKLKEKSFEDFLADLSAEEKKEIDELVSYKFSTDEDKEIKE